MRHLSTSSPRRTTPTGTWTILPIGTSFPSTSSIPRPRRCPSLAYVCGCSSARTCPCKTWTAHVRSTVDAFEHSDSLTASQHPTSQPGPVSFFVLVLTPYPLLFATPPSILHAPLYLIRFPTVGSYFSLQWLANLLVTATALGQNCTASYTAKIPLHLINLLATFGLSIIGTNLLCHRYLYEKARAMIQL